MTIAPGIDRRLTLGTYPPNHLVIRDLKETQYLKRPTIRTAKYLTNRIERNHRRIKQCLADHANVSECADDHC